MYLSGTLSSHPRTRYRKEGRLKSQGVLRVPLTQLVVQGNSRFAVIWSSAYRLLDIDVGGPA